MRLELVDLRAREQRRVDLEVGVLGRRADQRHEAGLDTRQQCVLLRLVEAVDLVEEEDRPASAAAKPLTCAREHLTHVRDRRLYRRQLLELGARLLGDDPCERRLPGARWAVEDQRRHPVLLDREPQGAAGSDHVLLAREIVERRRSQALGERRRRVQPPPRSLAEEVTHAESMLWDMSDAWGASTYERLSANFAHIHDQLVDMTRIGPGDRVLDLASGAGEVAVRAAARGAQVTGIDIAEPMLVKARERAEAAGAQVTFDLGDAEYLPYDDASFDVVVSNFGLIFAPDHANVASELARIARPGARLGFTAWKPNPKLGELYRRFTEEPIDGREAYEWGREDHVEDMLGEEFELEFEDGALWLEADSGEEIWKLFSESAPPVIALVKRLDSEGTEQFHQAFVELYEQYRAPEGGIRAPRRYLLVLGARK